MRADFSEDQFSRVYVKTILLYNKKDLKMVEFKKGNFKMATGSTSRMFLPIALTGANDLESYVSHFELLAELQKVDKNRRRSSPPS